MTEFHDWDDIRAELHDGDEEAARNRSRVCRGNGRTVHMGGVVVAGVGAVPGRRSR